MIWLLGVYYIVLFASVLVSVAFVTLLERKLLGLIQARVGPNKVGIWGVLQPFSDGIKLLSKSSVEFLFVKGFKYNFMPYGMFMIMLLMWTFVPVLSGMGMFHNGVLLIIGGFSLGVYPIMLGSWFSLSLYSMVGSVRSVAQIISYEVSMIMIIVSYVMFTSSFSMHSFLSGASLVLFYPLLFMLFLSMVIELSRTPSDLVEGESELVSGFNTEYHGFNFALVFLGEYGMILFSSGFFVTLVFGVCPLEMVGGVFTLLILVLVVVLRGALPRIRYDELMSLCWVSLIMFSISYFVFLLGILSLLW